jgi:hypothetical protein
MQIFFFLQKLKDISPKLFETALKMQMNEKDIKLRL